MIPNAAFEAIWKVVRTIPSGRVATYGQIARLAGLGRRARMVGPALSVEGVPSLPWHRVINAQGRISLPPNTESHKEQKRRLRGEGVRFVGGKVDLDKFGWRPRSESPLLD